MRSTRRYTNTFTKRVDHDGGRHRTLRAAAEPLICRTCGAIYADRRWTLQPLDRVLAGRHHLPVETICPACVQQAQGVPGGFLYLEGPFLKDHRDEIERLVTNEAERAAQDNPLGRIMRWDRDKKGRLCVVTTTEHLAQRLGHAVHKAFGGDVRYDFSHENKLARVYWHRE